MKLVPNSGADRVNLVRWKQDLFEDRNRLATLLAAAPKVDAARDANLAPRTKATCGRYDLRIPRQRLCRRRSQDQHGGDPGTARHRQRAELVMARLLNTAMRAWLWSLETPLVALWSAFSKMDSTTPIHHTLRDESLRHRSLWAKQVLVKKRGLV